MTNSEPKENTFTDDDLGALKQNASDPALKHLCDVLSKGMVLAILARLQRSEAERDAWKTRCEAAEKALDHNVPTDPDYIAWRKAAGK